MKKILIVLAGLIVVGVIVIYLLVGNLDKILKGAIEGAGSELLGVPVTVASVELDLKSGAGQITGISVANPAGYPVGVVIRGGLGGASGLPVVGYMVKQRTFGDVTRNYASAMEHSYERYAPDNLLLWPNLGPVPDL